MLIVLCLYVASAYSLCSGIYHDTLSQKSATSMRKDISEKINRMPMKYFESRTYGEVLSRVTNDVDTLGTELKPECDTDITSVTT